MNVGHNESAWIDSRHREDMQILDRPLPTGAEEAQSQSAATPIAEPLITGQRR